jgi:heat shock protein HtpX
MYDSVGKKLSRGLFEKMLKAESLKPSWTLSKLLAWLFAITVHSFTLALAILGVRLLVVGWLNLSAILGGLLLLIVWLLRPRFVKPPDEIAPREKLPTLYKVANDIAAVLGTSSVHGIVINEQFNAAFGQVGWRHRKIMYLGLPLFSILDAQERTVLIAHELAHSVNGDVSRGFVIGTAVDALVEWYRILYPDYSVVRVTGFEDLFLIPINLVRLILANIAQLGAFILVHLLYRDSQRAEYLADALAADVAGTEATLSMLEKSHLQKTYRLTVQKTALRRDSRNFFDELKHNVTQVPEREMERIRRVTQLEDSRLDITHPPTVYRMKLLQNRPPSKPQFVLSSSNLKQIEQEIAPLQAKVQQKLVDLYRESIS